MSVGGESWSVLQDTKKLENATNISDLSLKYSIWNCKELDGELAAYKKGYSAMLTSPTIIIKRVKSVQP